MPKVFASYYIVYVGIVVAAVTAPAYEKQSLGSATFWFGLVTLIILLVLVTYRYVKFKEVPDPAKPLICIYAAPTSLCIAGYVQSVMPKNYNFLMAMFGCDRADYEWKGECCIAWVKWHLQMSDRFDQSIDVDYSSDNKHCQRYLQATTSYM